MNNEKRVVNCVECFGIMDFVETYNDKDLYSCKNCGFKREEEIVPDK